MNRKFLPEVLSAINDDPKLIENYKDNVALKTIFEYSFIPEKKFALPEGDPPYKEDKAPIGMSPSNMFMELRRLYVFTAERDLPKIRREALFVQLLETLHPSEAKLLLAIKDQELTNLYKKITKDLLIDNGFLPETLREEKVKKDGARTRKKS